jgi:small-conductance mechanosensitive channel
VGAVDERFGWPLFRIGDSQTIVAVALGAGFAVTNIVENLLSGGIPRVEKPIRPGHVIMVHDKWLFIKRIGMRTTAALTYDGEEVLIPNSTVAQSVVTNLMRENRLLRIQISGKNSF